MRLHIVQLIVCNDGQHEITLHRTVEDAHAALRRDYTRQAQEYADSDDDLADIDHFIDALADYGIDAYTEAFILYTDDFKEV